MKHTLKSLACLLLLSLPFNFYAQNLLDLNGWTIGSGSASGFSQNGSTSENTREWGIGPHGNRVILWKASPDAGGGTSGGWDSNYYAIDHSKEYRVSVWIKKTNSNNGHSYLGCTGGGSHVLNLDGSVNNNAYFWVGDPPTLDRWYLIVGYVHGSGDNSTENYGGIYDGVTGKKVVNITDFKFQTSTSSLRHRSYLYYDSNTSDRQYFYAPRIDEVNGNEPTIAELLGIMPNSLDELSVGTDNLPSGYKLSVGGDAIMEKVKVQVEGAWPDYVFSDGHPLLSLDELQQYIKEHGHLPGIPSAKEIEEERQDLGLIQQKLLEKIEELTLYILEQNKGLKNLEIKNLELEQQMQQLKEEIIKKDKW
ncbi:hypothetical protein [Roseivirga sp. UBA838]|uniref:hypothetical protein n=1 Tax=Roseivirga sp. UBA838 TaxID=1947393 RepID=UPI00257E2CB6|nr:hypothetical protein [Roseivirga sp. UBA838]